MLKNMKRNPLVYLACTAWKYAEGSRLRVVLYLAMSLVATALAMSGPLVMAELMNTVQQLHGEELIAKGGWLLLFVLALGIGVWAFHGPSRVIESCTAFAVRRAFLSKVLERVLQLPVKWHQSNHSGKTIDQINRASSALGEFCEVSFEVLNLLGRFFGSAILLTWFMPQAGMAILTATTIVVITIVLFDRVLVKGYEKTNARYNEVNAAVQDFLTNVFTVISLRLERRVVKEVMERVEKIRPLVKSTSILNESKWFTTSFVVDVVRSAVLFGYLLTTVRRGDAVLIGTFFSLSQYLSTLGDSFFQFTGKYGELLIKAARLQGTEHIDESFESEVGIVAKEFLPTGWSTLQIEGLTFSHEKQAKKTLNRVNLTLQRGKTYAVVGESGSGKSTLLAVLRGLHFAQEGEVLVDGICVEGGLRAAAHHTTLIPQDPEIFEDSVRFNVTMGVTATDEEILRVLRMARFANVLNRLPRGLETSVAEKGVSLSGGERQRLALARGLFFAADADSEIVLLDESTSSVDLVNERAIYATVLESLKEKVVLSAVHKFNLLHFFDEIIVMEAGRVVECGSLQELITLSGAFSIMWERYTADSRFLEVGT